MNYNDNKKSTLITQQLFRLFNPVNLKGNSHYYLRSYKHLIIIKPFIRIKIVEIKSLKAQSPDAIG